jgi:protein-L-isoaspartate(D-aspartate) O-methyltransferase
MMVFVCRKCAAAFFAGILAAGTGGCATDWFTASSSESQTSSQSPADEYAPLRDRMVYQQLRARDIRDERVLGAMLKVPRHEFVPQDLRNSAYDDTALPLLLGQTISQPYIVAYMTQALQLRGSERVLEIGTGSGYQAAVLAELVCDVYTIEILPELSESAETILSSQGYKNIHFRVGDGYRGWPEQAPFDAIVVTAAPDHVPQPLVDQLKPGGRMIIPVGRFEQDLVLLEKGVTGVTRRSTMPVRFVPMTGKAQQAPPP